MDWMPLLLAPFGLLIGLSLGAVGGGGSILAVPVFVFVAGQSSKQATASSLFVVGTSALGGLPAHVRARRTRVVPGLAFGLSGVGGSFIGARMNSKVDPDVLLVSFAALVLFAAAAMWRRNHTPKRGSAPGAPGASGAESARRVTVATSAKVLLAGTVVGFMTGFFGVGGGFVIVPALVLSLGFTMPEAAGTSLLVIAVNSAVALFMKRQTAEFDWGLIIPFTVAAMIGVQIGARMSGRVDPRRLTDGFVVLLVLVALYTGVRAVGGMT